MIPNQSEVQTCMSCAETETRWQRDVERLERELHFEQGEKEEAFQRVAELEFHNRRLERDNYRLRTSKEDPDSKKPIKLGEEAMEFLNEWDELRRKYFKGSKTVPIGPDSTRAQRYRKARKNWSHAELMKCVKGVALSDWHTSDRDYFEPKSFLKEDERIAIHIERFEAAERMRDAGFDDEQFIRNCVQKPQKHKSVDWATPSCEDCGYERCRCGTGMAA